MPQRLFYWVLSVLGIDNTRQSSRYNPINSNVKFTRDTSPAGCGTPPALIESFPCARRIVAGAPGGGNGRIAAELDRPPGSVRSWRRRPPKPQADRGWLWPAVRAAADREEYEPDGPGGGRSSR
jgi:hypothetical protein